MSRKSRYIRRADKALGDLFDKIDRTASEPVRLRKRRRIFPESGGLGDKTIDSGDRVPYGRHERYWHANPVKLSASEIGVPKIEDDAWLRDPEKGRERFNLKSIEFGNWLNERERQHYLYGSMKGLDDMSRLFNVPRRQMGMGGKLSVALGARGHGDADAHYERHGSVAINIAYSGAEFGELATAMGAGPKKSRVARRRGKGALAHEYGHALDNMLAIKQGRGNDLIWMSGGYSVSHKIDESARGIRQMFEEVMRTLLWKTPNKRTPFGEYLQNLKRNKRSSAQYLNRRVEIWARTFEAWVAWKLEQKGIKNLWVAESTATYNRLKAYPNKTLLKKVDELIGKIVRQAFDMFEAPKPDPDPQTPKPEKPRPKPKPKGKRKRKKSTTSGSSSRVIEGPTTTVETQTDSIPAQYIVVELAELIPSHDPTTWSPHSLYPPSCQQRDYTSDKSEQLKVSQGASRLDPKFLLTDTPSATDGPPVVASNFVVLGGNGRTMMLQRAPKERLDAYNDSLLMRLEGIGFREKERKAIAAMKQPVLVRRIDADMSECARYSNMLNRGLTQSVDITTETISFARQLSPADLESIGNLFEQSESETIAEALRTPAIQRDIIRTFRTAGIITAQNQSQWLEPATGLLSDLGRLQLEKTLLGAILSEKAVTDAIPSYTNKIVRALPVMVRMQRNGGHWDLTPHFVEAIRLENRRRQLGQPRDEFIRQSDAFSAELDTMTESAWDLLELNPVAFKRLLSAYVSQAEREMRLDTSANFGFGEAMTPEELLTSLKQRQTDRGLGDDIEEPEDLSESDGPTTYTLRDLARARYPKVPLRGRWKKFLGEPPIYYKMIVWGLPGSGKSSASLDLAAQLAHVRDPETGSDWNVLYAAAEEEPRAGGFRKRSKVMRVRSERIHVMDTRSLDDIRVTLRTGDYNAVVVDSVSTLLPKDTTKIIPLLQEFSDLFWVLILHARMDGTKPKGFGDLEYFTDASIKADKGWLSTQPVKNRFGEPARLKIFPS